MVYYYRQLLFPAAFSYKTMSPSSSFENLSINQCGRRDWEVGKVQIYVQHQMHVEIFFNNMALEKFLTSQLLQNGLWPTTVK